MKLRALVLLLIISILSAAWAEVPRVLVIGDSTYAAAAQMAAKELDGRVQLVHAKAPSCGVLYTGMSDEDLDELLGDGKWDLIHFNFGLGDLLHRAPGMESIRALPAQAGGVRLTSPAEYEANLHKIITRLRKTKAMLVWANTTPIVDSGNGLYEVGSEIEYNSIAAKVIAEQRIPTNDMHAYAKSVNDLPKPAQRGPDPRKSLHPPVVSIICKGLRIPNPSGSNR